MSFFSKILTTIIEEFILPKRYAIMAVIIIPANIIKKPHFVSFLSRSRTTNLTGVPSIPNVCLI